MVVYFAESQGREYSAQIFAAFKGRIMVSRHVVLLLIAVASSIQLLSQGSPTSFAIIRTRVENATTISCRIAPLDASGLPASVGADRIQVTDNGVTLSGVTSCEPSSPGINLSLLVAIDMSSSSNRPLSTNFTPLAISKAAATAASDLLRLSFDEIGLLGIDALAELTCGLTSTKSQFANALQGFTPTGGFNLRRGLFDLPGGALTHLQNARNSRALLLLTDGTSRFDSRAAIAIARSFGIRVYVVGIGTVLNEDLRMLADSSGGASVEMVTTVIDARDHARAFVADAKRLPLCTVSWQTPNPCDSNRRFSLKLVGTNLQRNSAYVYPKSLVRRLEVSRRSVDMGIVQPGQTATEQVTYTAVNGTVTVSSYDLVQQDGFEIENPPSLPVTLTSGQSVSFSVKYSASAVDASYARLNLATDACSPEPVVIRAGSVYTGQTLQLVSPSGGEQFIAGNDTLVRWTNALPEDFIRLEVSYDNGVTWYSITEAATGLAYRWIPGPLTGERCQMRVSSTIIDQRSVLQLRGQTQPIYSAIFSEDDKIVLTGGDDGSVRAWDARTGQQTRIVGIHGNWVWSLAQMPGTSLVASASHDGTVRIWDFTTSRRVATISVDSRAWSVAFSADGKALFVGTDKSILRVSTDSWTIDKIITALDGPVFDVHVASGGRLLAAEGGRAVARDPLSLDTLRTFTDPSQRGAVYAISSPAAGGIIVTGGADFVLRKFSYDDGALVAKTTPGVGSILSLSFSPDDSTILTAGGDATAKLYSANTLSPQASLAGHSGIVYSAMYSHDGSSVVTASTDYTGRIWPLDKIGLISDVSDGVFSISGGTIQASNVSMGDVTVGEGADKVSTVVVNTGSAPLTIRSAQLLSSGTPTDFDVTFPALPVTLAAGAEFPLDVSFTPTAQGSRTATVELQTGRGPAKIMITGNGVQPSLKAQETLNFGRHVANQAVVDSVITVTANGDPSTEYNITLTQILEYQQSVFSIVSGGGPFSLRGGESRRITVRFDPKSFGRFAAVLNIRIDGRPAQIVRLYGEATGEGRLAATSSVLFTSTPCSSSPSQRSFVLRNTGNSETVLYSIGLEGSSADEFEILSPPTFPYTMAAKDSLTMTVRFDPKRVGVKDVRVVASSNASNALNGRTVVSMIARRDSVGFELSRTIVDLGNVAEGEPQSDRLQILNTGTISLQWPRGTINLGPFRIDSISPDITPGRRTSDMLVTFAGGQAGKLYETTYTFVDTICDRNQTVTLRAYVKSIIGGRVRIGKIDARTGELISVPVYVSNLTNMDRTTVKEFTMHCTVNGRILTPSGSTPAGTLKPDGSRSFSIPVPLTSKDSMATVLSFQTTWGNDTSSVIRIDSITVADTLQFRTFNGEVRLVDLCRISGRARLISLRSNGVGVSINPTPASTQASVTLDLVERGRTSVLLYDTQGRNLALLYDEDTPPGRWTIPLDLSSLHNGTYFVVMTTPSEAFTQRVEVIR